MINLTTLQAPRLNTPIPKSNGSFYVVKHKVLFACLSVFRPSAVAMIPTKPYATGTSQSKMSKADDHQSLLLRNHTHLKP